MSDTTRLEIKMAKLETQIEREVIPSLKRIEKSIDKAFNEIGDHDDRIDGLEDWREKINTQVETSAYLGKKAWLFMGGVIGGAISIITLAFKIYEKIKTM